MVAGVLACSCCRGRCESLWSQDGDRAVEWSSGRWLVVIDGAGPIDGGAESMRELAHRLGAQNAWLPIPALRELVAAPLGAMCALAGPGTAYCSDIFQRCRWRTWPSSSTGSLIALYSVGRIVMGWRWVARMRRWRRVCRTWCRRRTI